MFYNRSYILIPFRLLEIFEFQLEGLVFVLKIIYEYAQLTNRFELHKNSI